MSWIFAFLVLVAAYHFVYDGIILPGTRLQLRNDLFDLRDRMRRKMLELQADSPQYKAATMVHDGINTYINRVHLLTVSRLRDLSREISGNDAIRKRMEDRKAFIEQNADDNTKEVVAMANKVLLKALVANSGGWYVYVVPIGITIALVVQLIGSVRSMMTVPATMAERLFPRRGGGGEQYC